MNDGSLKQIIDTRLSAVKMNVTPEDIPYTTYNRKNTNRMVKKPVVLALSIGISLIVVVPVVAAQIPAFQQVVELVGNQIGFNLRPIQQVSMDQGIKMEVVAAMNDDETAIVYLTLQDTVQDRIDNTVDLYDYSVQGAKMFTHKLVEYDAVAKKATIQLLAHGAKDLNGKKVTLRLSSFLSGKQDMDHVDLGFNLDQEAAKQPLTMELDLNHIPGAGGLLLQDWREKEVSEIQVLQADHMNRSVPGVDMVQVANIGFVNGRLHVKTKWKESIDDNGDLYLLSERGERIGSSSVTYGVDEQGHTMYGHDYIEYIFDIGPTNISKYQLYGYFVKNHHYTEGNWTATFEMKAVDSSSVVLENIDLGTERLDQIEIQPLGITIVSRHQAADKLDVQLRMKDGTVQKYSHVLTLMKDGEESIKYLSDFPIQIENIAELRINDTNIPIKIQ